MLLTCSSPGDSYDRRGHGRSSKPNRGYEFDTTAITTRRHQIEMTARKTVKLIPGCQLKVYEGAAHGLPITHAEQLNADLLKYATS